MNSDTQQIVDNIRYALRTEDCELTDELREAAVGYARACRELNSQLRQVAQLLQKGLRSEAIQLAEGPPNLLDDAGLLNFPEVAEWAEVVAMYDLPRSEPLRLEVVDQINDALMAEQPLQKLLARHRRLAISRAPLKARLEVMRQLRGKDPETLSWDQDVRSFEQIRLREIAADAKAAAGRADSATLATLQMELDDPEWSERPPAKLSQAVRSALADINRKFARRELDGLVEQLEAAFSELDAERARSLRVRWNDLSQRSALPTADPLRERLEPVFGWLVDEDGHLERERRYDRALAEFQQALASEADLDELDRLAHQIRQLDRELPDLVATRYRHRRDALELAGARRHRLQMIAIGAVLLTVTGLAAVLIRNQINSQDVERLAHRVGELLDSRQYAAARSALDERRDSGRWNELNALRTRLEQEQSADMERSKRLTRTLEDVQRAASPDEALRILEPARPDVVSEDDKLAFSRLERELKDQQRRALAERESAVQVSLQELSNAVLRLETEMGAGTGSDETGTRLAGIAARLGQLEIQVKGLRSDLTSQLQLIMARRTQLETLRKGRLLRQDREQELTRSALIDPRTGNLAAAVPQLSSAIQAYAESMGETRVAAELRRSADEHSVWQGALEWLRLTSSWRDVWPDGSAAQQTRLDQVREFLLKNPKAADAAEARTYKDQLEAVHVPLSAGGNTAPAERLRRVFRNDIVAASWTLTAKDGRVFYLPKEEMLDPLQPVQFKMFVGYSKEEVETQSRVQARELNSLVAVPSPSQALAKFVSERLSSLREDQWNEFCLELGKQVHDTPQLHPCLRLDLTRRVLEAASARDVFLKSELEPPLKLLQSAQINPLARWMNPDDQEGQKAGREATAVIEQLSRLSSVEGAFQKADLARTQFAQRLSRTGLLVGWLTPEPDGARWGIRSQWKPADEHELQVLLTDAAQGITQWRKIGTAGPAGLVISPGVDSFLSAGRPVFAIRERRSAAP